MHFKHQLQQTHGGLSALGASTVFGGGGLVVGGGGGDGHDGSGEFRADVGEFLLKTGDLVTFGAQRGGDGVQGVLGDVQSSMCTPEI